MNTQTQMNFCVGPAPVELELPDFDKLVLRGNIDLIFCQSVGRAQMCLSSLAERKVEWEALPSGELCLSALPPAEGRESLPLVVRLTAPSLSQIDSAGALVLHSQGPVSAYRFFLRSEGSLEGGMELSVHTFAGEIHGEGALTLTGVAGEALVEVRGRVRLNARNLRARVVDAWIHGPAVTEFYAAQQAIVSADGFARVWVHGRPNDFRKHPQFAWIRRV